MGLHPPVANRLPVTAPTPVAAGATLSDVVVLVGSVDVVFGSVDKYTDGGILQAYCLYEGLAVACRKGDSSIEAWDPTSLS